MELRLNDGDYTVTEQGALEVASGTEELLQRVLFRLKTHRGGFAPMPELGSRLYLLQREKPSHRQGAAEQYVLEALREEEDLVVERVQLTQNGDTISVTVALLYQGESLRVALEV